MPLTGFAAFAVVAPLVAQQPSPAVDAVTALAFLAGHAPPAAVADIFSMHAAFCSAVQAALCSALHAAAPGAPVTAAWMIILLEVVLVPVVEALSLSQAYDIVVRPLTSMSADAVHMSRATFIVNLRYGAVPAGAAFCVGIGQSKKKVVIRPPKSCHRTANPGPPEARPNCAGCGPDAPGARFVDARGRRA
jgi:hypothetical protein